MSTMRVVLTASQASRGHPRAAGATVILLLVADDLRAAARERGRCAVLRRVRRRAGGRQRQRESRKVVTVLFCDVVGSTALGDPRPRGAPRAHAPLLRRDLRAILERHGGTVEKFVGDAVMAVFGIPVAHEDDALRAVRAAWRDAGGRAGASGSTSADRRQHGRGRVAGEGETLVTGDAVNVAARLEQAASRARC